MLPQRLPQAGHLVNSWSTKSKFGKDKNCLGYHNYIRMDIGEPSGSSSGVIVVVKALESSMVVSPTMLENIQDVLAQQLT